MFDLQYVDMISKVKEQLRVACPFAQADIRLRHYFITHGNKEGNVVKLTLKLPFDIPGSTPIERSVIAVVQRLFRSDEQAAHYFIEWAAEEPGPFPLFSGHLLIEECANDSFLIKLNGEYSPPYSVFGVAFDMVFGKRIAHATVCSFLEDMKAFIEQDTTSDPKLPEVSLHYQ